MLRTLKLFVDLCLLRADPQDLPHSVALELLTLLIYTTLGYVLALSSTKPGTALLAALVDVAMLVGLAYAGLWILDLKSRLTKLVTALAGSGAVWQLVALPVMAQNVADDKNRPSDQREQQHIRKHGQGVVRYFVGTIGE